LPPRSPVRSLPASPGSLFGRSLCRSSLVARLPSRSCFACPDRQPASGGSAAPARQKGTLIKAFSAGKRGLGLPLSSLALSLPPMVGPTMPVAVGVCNPLRPAPAKARPHRFAGLGRAPGPVAQGQGFAPAQDYPRPYVAGGPAPKGAGHHWRPTCRRASRSPPPAPVTLAATVGPRSPANQERACPDPQPPSEGFGSRPAQDTRGQPLTPRQGNPSAWTPRTYSPPVHPFPCRPATPQKTRPWVKKELDTHPGPATRHPERPVEPPQPIVETTVRVPKAREPPPGQHNPTNRAPESPQEPSKPGHPTPDTYTERDRTWTHSKHYAT